VSVFNTGCVSGPTLVRKTVDTISVDKKPKSIPGESRDFSRSNCLIYIKSGNMVGKSGKLSTKWGKIGTFIRPRILKLINFVNTNILLKSKFPKGSYKECLIGS